MRESGEVGEEVPENGSGERKSTGRSAESETPTWRKLVSLRYSADHSWSELSDELERVVGHLFAREFVGHYFIINDAKEDHQAQDSPHSRHRPSA